MKTVLHSVDWIALFCTTKRSGTIASLFHHRIKPS